MISSMWLTKFCYLSLIYINIDLIRLDFVVNGEWCQRNWRTPIE